MQETASLFVERIWQRISKILPVPDEVGATENKENTRKPGNRYFDSRQPFITNDQNQHKSGKNNTFGSDQTQYQTGKGKKGR